MKLIQIDFTNTSSEDLKVILKKHSIKYDQLMEKHKTWSFHKIFIDLDSFKLFAYILNSDKEKIEFTEALNEVMLSIKPETVDKTPEPDIVFDVDHILEKISKFGINSLTKAEKDFLDSQKD